MSPGTEATRTIGNSLNEEIARLEEFVPLLQREQDLLKRGESDALLALIGRKNTLSGSLAAIAKARESLLVALGLPAGRAGVEAWLDRSGETAQRQAWQHLLRLAGTARDLNLLNGRLIGLHMQHNQQALAALMAAADKLTTYGPDGQQQAGGGGRILGTA